MRLLLTDPRERAPCCPTGDPDLLLKCGHGEAPSQLPRPWPPLQPRGQALAALDVSGGGPELRAGLRTSERLCGCSPVGTRQTPDSSTGQTDGSPSRAPARLPAVMSVSGGVARAETATTVFPPPHGHTRSPKCGRITG